ncbi:MAG: DeoR/GlpR transcriptional regulator [Clostridiales bacterium]|nr:DeoR/GlpR transcriptional regulator [Clostridiales bacterium]
MSNFRRKESIINLIERDKEVSVNELSELLGASKETIRRDLADLEQKGFLVRVHGGAVYNREADNSLDEYPMLIRGIQRHEEKNQICAYAAALIEDGDTIFIDNSSTVVYLLKCIPEHIHLTVITNSVQILLEAARVKSSNIQCFCLGGSFKAANLSIYGGTALKEAEEYYPNKMFLSCAGIRADGLVTDSSMQEAEIKRLMLNNSSKVYYLVDHTKFHTIGQVRLDHISANSTIITDSSVNPAFLEPIRKLGAEVLIAK